MSGTTSEPEQNVKVMWGLSLPETIAPVPIPDEIRLYFAPSSPKLFSSDSHQAAGSSFIDMMNAKVCKCK